MDNNWKDEVTCRIVNIYLNLHVEWIKPHIPSCHTLHHVVGIINRCVHTRLLISHRNRRMASWDESRSFLATIYVTNIDKLACNRDVMVMSTRNSVIFTPAIPRTALFSYPVRFNLDHVCKIMFIMYFVVIQFYSTENYFEVIFKMTDRPDRQILRGRFEFFSSWFFEFWIFFPT